MGRPRVPWKPVFYSRIVRRGAGQCWLWTGYTNSYGYGIVSCNRSHDCYSELGEGSAHRVSWVLHRGPIPHGLMVLHTCDVRNCVNPNHLFLGTAKDNYHDMRRKGRQAEVPTKLTYPDVRLMKQLKLSGVRTKDLANRFRVSRQTVRKITTGKSWQGVQ